MTDEVTHAKTASLTPDSGNANAGTERGAAMLETSLRKYGAGRSILLDKAGRVIAGNKTLQQASDIGIDDVLIVHTTGDKLVAVQRDDLDLADDDTGARALAYADNRTSEIDLSWDAAVIFADLQAGVPVADFWTDAELAELLAVQPTGTGGDSEAQVDRAAELAEEWSTAVGQVWSLGDHRLAIGDCTDAATVEAVMRGERAEMVFLDPPYGVAVGDKNKYLNSIAPSNRVEANLQNDTLGEPALRDMLQRSFANVASVCKPGGAWYVAAPARPLHVIFGQELKALGIWHQTIQWVKNNATFSPMGVDYHWQAEPIFYGWLPGAGHRYYGGRQQTTVWQIDRPLKSPEHPTMKPVELVERAIENSSKAGEIVIDFFVGSGTTILAAANLGRKSRAIELDLGYAAVTLDRFQRHTSITPVLL